MEDLATLGIAVDASSVDQADAKLDKLTNTGGKAESQIDKLVNKSKELGASAKTLGVSIDEVDRRVEALKSSTDPLYAAQAKLNKELEEAKTLYKANAISAGDYGKIQEALTGKLNRVTSLQQKAAAGAKLHAHEMLNLSRQSADVGVSLAMGMNPLMVLIQQGPQIAETFATAGARGLGFKAVLLELAGAGWAAVAPLAPFIAAAGAAAAVIGGGFLLATREANKAAGDLTAGMNLTKDELEKLEKAGVSTKITFGDTFSAVFTVAGQRLYKAFEGPIKTVQGWFSTLYNGIVKGAEWMAQAFTAVIIGIGRIGKELFAGLAAAFRGDFKTAADHLTKSTSEVLSGTWEKAGKLNKDFWGDVVDTAADARKKIIENTIDRKDKKPEKAKKSEAEKELERATKASQDYIKQLEKETATVGKSAIEQKRWEIAHQASIAPTLELAAAIREKGEALIAATKAAVTNSMVKGLDEENAQIALQRELIDATNKERAVKLAIQATEQELTRNEIDLASEGAKAVLAKVKANTEAQFELDNGVTSTLSKLQQMAALSANAAAGIASTVGSLGAAFGSVGTSLGGILTTYADLLAKQDEFAVKMEELRRANKEDSQEYRLLADAKATAERRASGDMIKSAKGFFKEKSTGYKVLEAAEKAWRLFEFAMEAKSLIVKATGSATRIALSGAEAAASATAGAAHMFATLGPLGFAAVAAMGVVLAAWGFKGGKGSGGGNVPTAEDIQAAQGTGSVFGDPTAKSASLANSLTLADKYQNKDLEYSSGMLSALKSIDNKMSVLAVNVARQIGLSGGMFDTSGLGLGSKGSSGVLGMFGKSKTVELNDLGLQFANQSVADILANGINGNTYQQTKTTTKKSGVFGIGGGTKTTYNTVTGEIDEAIKESIGEVVASLRGGVLEAAKVLGLEGAQATIDALTLSIGKVSFEGMSGSEIQEALNAVFGKLGDDMASAVGGGLVERFKQIGEGAFETLSRIAVGMTVFDQQFDLMGKTLGLTGIKAVEAKQGLIDLMGGLEPFLELTNQYAEEFLTDAERIAPVQKAVNTELGRLGLSAVTTKDQFKALVAGIDVSTEKGSELFTSLMKLAPAFAKVANYADEATKKAAEAAQAEADRLQKLEDTAKANMEKARSSLVDTYTAEANALKSLRDKWRNASKDLRDFITGLTSGELAYLTPEQAYLKSKSAFDQTLGKARGGDETAVAQLSAVGEEFAKASREYFASSGGYFNDRDYIVSAVEEVARFADSQATEAEKQLDALNNLLDGVDGVIDGIVKLGDTTLSVRDGVYTVDASVKTVAAGIADFKTSMAAYTDAINNRITAAEAAAKAAAASAEAAAAAQLAAAQQIANAINQANTPTPANSNDPVTAAVNDPAAGAWNAASFLASRPDVQAEADRLLATADRNSPWFAQHGLNNGAEGFATWYADQNNLRKPFAHGGVIDRPMTLGEAGIGGEAGPEGLVPLRRMSNGSLGVQSKQDEETKALLKEIRDYLKAGNAKQTDAHRLLMDKLEKLVSSNEDFAREVARA